MQHNGQAMGNNICNCNKGNDESKTELLPEETIFTIEDLQPTDENDRQASYRNKINQPIKHDRRMPANTLPAKYKAAQYVLDDNTYESD